jgi:hypothetical protein
MRATRPPNQAPLLPQSVVRKFFATGTCRLIKRWSACYQRHPCRALPTLGQGFSHCCPYTLPTSQFIVNHVLALGHRHRQPLWAALSLLSPVGTHIKTCFHRYTTCDGEVAILPVQVQVLWRSLHMLAHDVSRARSTACSKHNARCHRHDVAWPFHTPSETPQLKSIKCNGKLLSSPFTRIGLC